MADTMFCFFFRAAALSVSFKTYGPLVSSCLCFNFRVASAIHPASATACFPAKHDFSATFSEGASSFNCCGVSDTTGSGSVLSHSNPSSSASRSSARISSRRLPDSFLKVARRSSDDLSRASSECVYICRRAREASEDTIFCFFRRVLGQSSGDNMYNPVDSNSCCFSFLAKSAFFCASSTKLSVAGGLTRGSGCARTIFDCLSSALIFILSRFACSPI
mmetsp:Transcript_8866/g.18838  ORF Transcript_8866/g.18838 Transcript_8866/m.18838 type:complete len:219 (-) Transcript_8866:468-1124(-)